MEVDRTLPVAPLLAILPIPSIPIFVMFGDYFDSTAMPYTCVQAREKTMKCW